MPVCSRIEPASQHFCPRLPTLMCARSDGPILAGEQDPLQMAKIALRQQAERLLPYTDGKFSPSPPPAALENLTDELVVVAAEVVGIIGAGLGVNARFRLLGWVVADARGAQVVMEPNLALTVGKRLDRQAQYVRDACTRAVAKAEAELLAAEQAAAADAALQPALPAKLLEIDRARRQALTQPSQEVYIGFRELDGLFGEEEATPPPAVPPAATPPATEPPPAANGSGDALALRLLEELRAAQQEAQTAREEAQAARLAEQAAQHQLETRWKRAFEKAEEDAEDTVRRLHRQRRALTEIIRMLQDALGEGYMQLEETLEVAGRVSDECIELGAAAGADAGREYPSGWGHRLLINRLMQARVTMNDIMVYHGMAEESLEELYTRSQDDVRGSFARMPVSRRA